MSANQHLKTSRRHFITRAGAGAAGITLFPAGRLWSAGQTDGDASPKNPTGQLRFALCNEMFENSTMADIRGRGKGQARPELSQVSQLSEGKAVRIALARRIPNSPMQSRARLNGLRLSDKSWDKFSPREDDLGLSH